MWLLGVGEGLEYIGWRRQGKRASLVGYGKTVILTGYRPSSLLWGRLTVSLCNSSPCSASESNKLPPRVNFGGIIFWFVIGLLGGGGRRCLHLPKERNSWDNIPTPPPFPTAPPLQNSVTPFVTFMLY